MFQRLLLTNDDGIEAPGLAALARACETLAEEVIVVAPRDPASQIGHRVTTDEPIGLTHWEGDHHYAVHGSPADCVRIALKALLQERPPDLVISGINYGGNLGRHDFYISGTVAAAREAAFQGIPAAAISNFHRRDLPFSWDTSARRARETIRQLWQGEPALEAGEFWNINLPHVPETATEPVLRRCEMEEAPLEVTFVPEPGEDENAEIHRRFRYTGRYHERDHDGKSDVAVCFGGNIAVTRARP